jgi:hypothetical protein
VLFCSLIFRYFIIVKINRTGPLSVTEEKELFVIVLQEESEVNTPIQLEVGVRGQLHIEFEYSKSRFEYFYWDTDLILGIT